MQTHEPPHTVITWNELQSWQKFTLTSVQTHIWNRRNLIKLIRFVHPCLVYLVWLTDVNRGDCDDSLRQNDALFKNFFKKTYFYWATLEDKNSEEQCSCFVLVRTPNTLIHIRHRGRKDNYHTGRFWSYYYIIIFLWTSIIIKRQLFWAKSSSFLGKHQTAVSIWWI